MFISIFDRWRARHVRELKGGSSEDKAERFSTITGMIISGDSTMPPLFSRKFIFILVCFLVIGISCATVLAQNGCTPGATGNNADNTITCVGTIATQVDGN